jgi:hypothetical protein
LDSAIEEIFQSGQSKFELYVSYREPNGKVISFGIPSNSALFPKLTSDPLAYFLVHDVGLHIEFYKGQPQFDENLGQPDLLFRVQAFMDSLTQQMRIEARQLSTIVNLRYNSVNYQFSIIASDTPCPSRPWSNNGIITSIPTY